MLIQMKDIAGDLGRFGDDRLNVCTTFIIPNPLPHALHFSAGSWRCGRWLFKITWLSS